MTSAFGDLNGSGNQQIWANLYYISYNQAGNYSTWGWEVRYYGNGWGTWGATLNWSMSGFAATGGTRFISQGERYDTYTVLGGGQFSKGHDANGYLAAGSMGVSLSSDHSSIGSGGTTVHSGTPPRIPKPPTAPGTPSLTPTATTVAASWTAPGNLNGAPLLGYQAQVATNAGFTTGVATLAPSGTSVTFSDRTPGTTQYVRVRGRNSAGFGAWSATASLDLWTAPDAPNLHYVTQDGDRTLLVQWDAGYDGGSPTLGWQVGVAADPSFTVTTTRTYPPSPHDVLFPDVAPGTAYVRVRGRNSAGFGAWSAPVSTTVTGDVGDLDGWHLVGALPDGFAPVVGDGLRRTSTGLALEALKTDTETPSPQVVTIAREFTDLKIGATYRFEATVQAGAVTYGNTLQPGTPVDPLPRGYTRTVVPVTPNETIGLAFAVVIPSAAEVDDWALNVQLSEVKLIEIREPSPYRLGDTVYEGPLATHFDYACNTVGAGWWVARDNTVTFREWNSYPAPVAHFTDEDTLGTLSYTDISAAYDTRNVATVLTVSNHGRDGETGEADDADYQGENTAATAEWGRREASLDMTLYDPATHVGGRMTEILGQVAAPEQTITGIRWNAQSDPALAASLDMQDRLDVTFQGTTQRCRVLGIKHDVRPDRWMIDLTLRKDK